MRNILNMDVERRRRLLEERGIVERDRKRREVGVGVEVEIGRGINK